MGDFNMLYVVEIMDADAPRHRADFDLVTSCMNSDGQTFLPKVEAAARAYWTSVPNGTPEVLTASSLRILEIANSEP